MTTPEDPLSNNSDLALMRAPSAKGLASFYNGLWRERGISMPPHLTPICMALADPRIRRLMIVIGPGAGKALAPDTLVLTPIGWAPIRDLRVGSHVMTPDGKTWAMVRGVFWQKSSRLYRVTFADGRQITANAEHLWKVHTKKFAKRGEPMRWRIRTTEEIAGYMWHNRANRWYVPLCAPVDLPAVDLPMPPYLLGAIIGDGHIAKDGDIQLTNMDQEIVERCRKECERQGGRFTQRAGGMDYGILDFAAEMDELRLSGKRSWEKRIPPIYLRGSAAQRLAMLQGLMDTDGYADQHATCSFSSTSRGLAEDVAYLVRSLGGIASISPKKTKYNSSGMKVAGRPAFQVNIRHPTGADLFHLSRKKERMRIGQYSADLKLEIISIEAADVHESVCISIDHPDGLFLAENFVVTHNSLLLSVTYPCWLLGIEPNQTILGVSGGESLVQGFMHACMEVIEWSRFYSTVFPETRPDRTAGWSTERGLFVTGRLPGDPDASYWGAGLTSATLTGKHGRTLIFDDLHNADNSATAAQCEKVVGRYYDTLIGRADPQGARFIIAGRRFSENDIYGHLKDSGDWVVLELPAERDGTNELYYDLTLPDGLRCCFNEG